MTFADYEIAIASLISDFRKGELPIELDKSHVDKWIRQFDVQDWDVILAETFHVLNDSYYKEDKLTAFCKCVLKRLAREKSLDKYSFLANQEVGESQKRLLKRISEIAKKEYNINIQITDDVNEMQRVCVYIDDGLYTGKRIRKDLKKILTFVQDKEILVFLIAAYSNNFEYRKKKLAEFALKGNNTIIWIVERIFDNDKQSGNRNDTVWPHVDVLKDEQVREYGCEIAGNRKMTYIARNKKYTGSLFSSEKSARIVENAFLFKGLEIIENIKKTSFRPLGMDDNVSFGFGSFFATDMNISNTCPLVLWWGTIEETGNQAVDCWYPLLPRRSNETMLTVIQKEETKRDLSRYTDVLLAVHRLAKERSEIEKKDTFSIGDFSFDDFHKSREKDELLKFLYNMNLDQIKIIAAMMYIGRDFRSERQEYYYDIIDNEDEKDRIWDPYPVKNPDYIVNDFLDELEETFEEDKYYWVEQVYEKIPLDMYLENAFHMMGILQ